MKKGILLTASLLMTVSCGPSLASLNQLAAQGSIHESAPVVARVHIEIAAPPGKVWELLVAARAWPAWHNDIESVTAPGPLDRGTRFTWNTGGTTIHSQVQLCRPLQQLTWTGTVLTAKAIHVWELKPAAANNTLVLVKESMDGPAMSALFSSQKLAASDQAWLAALKQAAER